MTKLISLNIGAHLTVLEDGVEHTYEFSAICPSKDVLQPYWIPIMIQSFLSEKLNVDIYMEEKVEIAKPSKIKAAPTLSHRAFNRRVKKNIESLGYKP